MDNIDRIEIENMCPICCCNMEAETKTFVCDHKYCQNCIVTWYKKCVSEGTQPMCPLCRRIDNIWST